MDIIEIVGWISMGLGTFFIFTGTIGMFRMPDIFTRLHPVGMNDSIGAPLIFLGIMLHTEFGLITAKIMLLVLFAFVTSSTATYSLGRSAYLSGVKPIKETKGKKKA